MQLVCAKLTLKGDLAIFLGARLGLTTGSCTKAQLLSCAAAGKFAKSANLTLKGDLAIFLGARLGLTMVFPSGCSLPTGDSR